jgi:hypothetical protein
VEGEVGVKLEVGGGGGGGGGQWGGLLPTSPLLPQARFGIAAPRRHHRTTAVSPQRSPAGLLAPARRQGVYLASPCPGIRSSRLRRCSPLMSRALSDCVRGRPPAATVSGPGARGSAEFSNACASDPSRADAQVSRSSLGLRSRRGPAPPQRVISQCRPRRPRPPRSRRSGQVSPLDLAVLRARQGAHNRPTQPLNGRAVYDASPYRHIALDHWQ